MPSLPNDGDAIAGPGVERDEAIARRHVEDAFLFAVGPVREPAARELARRRAAARALVLTVHPLQFSGGRVERDDRTPGAAGRVQPAADHERRGLEIELEARTEVVGLEAPRHFELAEVGCGDLIERRVARVPEVAAVGPPLALRRARLTLHRRRGP